MGSKHKYMNIEYASQSGRLHTLLQAYNYCVKIPVCIVDVIELINIKV